MRPSTKILFKCALLWLPLLTFLPCLIFVLLIFSFYKLIVLLLSKLLTKNDLITPVSGLDVFFSTDNFYKRPIGGIGFIWILNGHISPQIIITRLENALKPTENKIILNQSENNYQKLTSLVPCFWMGYPFWKKANPFSIQNHVKVMKPINQNNLNKKISDWMLEPFTEGIPLWEFRIVPEILPISSENKNLGKKRSLLLFKTHHMLGDGYSMTSFLSKITDSHVEVKCASKWKQCILRNKKCDNFQKNILNAAQLFFLLPLTLVSLINQFVLHHDNWFTSKKTSENVNLATTHIPISRLIDIRKELRSSEVNADLARAPIIVMATSALAGALRRLLTEETNSKIDDNGIPVQKFKTTTIPQTVNFVTALPIEGQGNHPGRNQFINFWTHGILSANMRELSSIDRLSLLNENYINMQSKRIPEIYFHLLKLFSLFPERILRIFTGFQMGASIGVTNVAGPTEPVFIGGSQVLSKFGYAGLLWKHASLTLCMFSYDGNLGISVLANEDVIQDAKNVEKLISTYFIEELEALKNQEENSECT